MKGRTSGECPKKPPQRLPCYTSPGENADLPP
nr:MAG TPA: hypothetical protein [Caudoviricetes sp.]